jgi:glycosyltransferase involved in cell wall biosynthesis
VEAFNHLGLPLVVIGDGPDYRRLRRLAGPTVQLAGRLSDAVVAKVLQGARALIMTAVEEFGIVAVESQAAGRPVIARRGGGALETVVDGITGCFWSGGPRELARAVVEFDTQAVDQQACTGNAARFDAAVFRRRMLSEVETATREGPRSAAERGRAVPERLLRTVTEGR